MLAKKSALVIISVVYIESDMDVTSYLRERSLIFNLIRHHNAVGGRRCDFALSAFTIHRAFQFQ